MFKKQTCLLIVLLLFINVPLRAQNAVEAIAVVNFNGIAFSYAPASFGALLPAYEEGTPFQADAPYFANTAPPHEFHVYAA